MTRRVRQALAVLCLLFITVGAVLGFTAAELAALAVFWGAALLIFPSSDHECDAEFVGDNDDVFTCARTGVHLAHRTADGTWFRVRFRSAIINAPEGESR